jgi:hypothetical protein
VKKELTSLHELKAQELSVVDRGANKKRRFSVTKSEKNTMKEEILKSVIDTELGEKEEKAIQGLIEKSELSEKGSGALEAAHRILESFKDEIPAEAIAKFAELHGAKIAKEFPPPKEDEEETDEMKKEREAKEKAEKEKGAAVQKSEVQKKFEDIEKAHKAEIDALKENNEKITKALKEEKDTRRLSEWTQKAEKELSHFPGKSIDEIAKSLMELEDLKPELAKSQFESMKAASDAMKENNIFKSAGESYGGSTAKGSAWDQIEKLADGLVEKSDDLDMTKEKAIDRVLKSEKGMKLYAEYEKEQAEALK